MLRKYSATKFRCAFWLIGNRPQLAPQKQVNGPAKITPSAPASGLHSSRLNEPCRTTAHREETACATLSHETPRERNAGLQRRESPTEQTWKKETHSG